MKTKSFLVYAGLTFLSSTALFAGESGSYLGAFLNRLFTASPQAKAVPNEATLDQKKSPQAKNQKKLLKSLAKLLKQAQAYVEHTQELISIEDMSQRQLELNQPLQEFSRILKEIDQEKAALEKLGEIKDAALKTQAASIQSELKTLKSSDIYTQVNRFRENDKIHNPTLKALRKHNQDIQTSYKFDPKDSPEKNLKKAHQFIAATSHINLADLPKKTLEPTLLTLQHLQKSQEILEAAKENLERDLENAPDERAKQRIRKALAPIEISLTKGAEIWRNWAAAHDPEARPDHHYTQTPEKLDERVGKLHQIVALTSRKNLSPQERAVHIHTFLDTAELIPPAHLEGQPTETIKALKNRAQDFHKILELESLTHDLETHASAKEAHTPLTLARYKNLLNTWQHQIEVRE